MAHQIVQEKKTLGERVHEIKCLFPTIMNGVVAQSMREKGVNYRVNWGASLVLLRKIAYTITPDKELAEALWKEEVRECKILAILVMPPKEMDLDLAKTWIKEANTLEVIEILASNLLYLTSFAPQLALYLIAQEREPLLVCGYNVVSRLFMQGEDFSVSWLEEYFIRTATVLKSGTLAIKKAARTSLIKLSQRGEEVGMRAKCILEDMDTNLF